PSSSSLDSHVASTATHTPSPSSRVTVCQRATSPALVLPPPWVSLPSSPPPPDPPSAHTSPTDQLGRLPPRSTSRRSRPTQSTFCQTRSRYRGDSDSNSDSNILSVTINLIYLEGASSNANSTYQYTTI
ncbi:hypothetical protein SAMD00019534_024680, partial [Acytostelium subglobosum LB1]|uniref:hypothetical protein n=1 Tax=Acytostelium subglobosum LB1 TaxID=1410327 RepID=UPI000644D23F